jgi:hypothetical protein
MRKKRRSIEEANILHQTRELREQIRLTRLQFDQTVEPELIEAYVFELNALQARYNYFLRLAREMELEQSYAEVTRPLETAKS